jgi:uncharacterized protein involved in outer membrane biogenesis
MRRLIWAAALLVVIAAVLLGAAALSLNRIIAREHDHLLQQAHAALGRDIAAGRISMHLWSGIGIRVDDLRVADDPRFGTADFARAASVIVRAKVLPLLRGRLEVGRIDLTQPHIQLIRNSAGEWNYATLGHAASTTEAQPGTSAPRTAVPSAVPPEQLPFVISRANIADGAVTVIDRSREPEETTRLAQVDVSVADIGENTPISFSADAAIQGDQRNVHVRGIVGPWRQASRIPLRLDGSLGPIGPYALRVGDLHLEAVLTPVTLDVSQLSGRAFDGSFQLAGQYPLRHDGEVSLKGALSHIALAEVLQLAMHDAPERFAGTGRLTVNVHAAGGAAEAMRASLAGQVAADAQDAVLKDFNLVNEILGQLTDLPKVGELVSRKVKPKYARLFSEPHTRFRALHASFQIAQQRMRTEDLTIEAADYDVRAAGWIGFNREMDLTGTLAMSKAFTRDVVADVKEAQYLVDDHEQLAIPFGLRGQIGKARPRPDTAYLVARLSQAIAPGAVKDLVEKFLGTKRQQPAAPKPGRAENPIEQQLRNLLGR